jgi:CRISPR-associated protein Csb2
MQTAQLQSQGWSQPPGSRRVLYWRRSNALDAGAPIAAPATARAAAPVDAALLAVAARNGSKGLLPPCSSTLALAEAVHDTLVCGPERVEELIGKDASGTPLTGHRHAHVLPLDRDADGRIDHVLIWAPGKLSAAAQASIRRLCRIYGRRVPQTRLALEGFGDARAFAEHMKSVFGSPHGSSTWVSVTPFVPPRHLRGDGPHSLAGQLRAEVASRGLPEVTSVEVLERGDTTSKRLRSFRHFLLERGKGRPPPVRMGYALRVVFAEAPPPGPISLGYASHFGLGRFEAEA